jgi:hypothetical protein
MISQGQYTLLPDSTRAARKPRTLRYEISSYDRNFATEQTNRFRWRLPNPIREICEVSIVGGSVPQPVTNIFSQNTQTNNYSYNKFTVSIGGTSYNLTIPNGNYTATSLAAALQTALDALPPAVTFTCAVNPLNGGITITASVGNFSFLFGTGAYVDTVDTMTKAVLNMNSPALLLGFLPGVDVTSSGSILASPNSMDVNMLVNRIFMYFNYDTSQDLVAYDRGLGRRQPSAIIYMDAVSNDRKYLNKDTYAPLIVAKPAPIARINALDVSFEDFFGNPIDFGGREVSLAIECVSLEN